MVSSLEYSPPTPGKLLSRGDQFLIQTNGRNGGNRYYGFVSESEFLYCMDRAYETGLAPIGFERVNNRWVMIGEDD